MARNRLSRALLISLVTSFCFIFIGCTSDIGKAGPLSSVEDHVERPNDIETESEGLLSGKPQSSAVSKDSLSPKIDDIPRYPWEDLTEQDLTGLAVWGASNRPKTKEIVVPTEMGMEPVSFEMLDLAYLPFTTYIANGAAIRPIKRGTGTGVLFEDFEFGDLVEVMFFKAEDSAYFEQIVKSLIRKYFPDLRGYDLEKTRESAYNFDAQKAGGRIRTGRYNDYFFYIFERWPLESEMSADARDVPFKEWTWRDSNEKLGKTDNQKEEADRKIQQYIAGLTHGSPQLIVDLMDNGARNYYGMEAAKAAIEDYRIIFGSAKLLYELESINYYGQEKYFRYFIFGSGGKKIEVTFISSKDGIHLIGDRFLIYSWLARRNISGFVEALRSQNAQEVASALHEDDLWYPVAEAQSIIKKYKEEFALDTINYRLIGMNERDDFIYVISGSKNPEFKEHQLTIVCGDNLTGIRDEWFPSTQEVGLFEPETSIKDR